MRSLVASIAAPVAALVLLASCESHDSSETPPADLRPNILFILSDDQRPDSLGVYGNSSIRTPRLDRLAEEGARFDAFYVASPACASSRAALLTGLYGHQTGVLGNAAIGPHRAPPDLNRFGMPTADLAPGTRTVAHALADAGYVTGFVGKTHLGGDPRPWGFREAPVWLPGAGMRHRAPELRVAGEKRVFPNRTITRVFTDAAIDFVERHRDERWFLWLATSAPHIPYLADPRHAYRREDIAPPPHWPPDQPLSTADWPAYYSTISMLDEELGRVLDALDRLGLRDRTLVLFASDNGHMQSRLGEKRSVSSKGVWFEDAVRVPALARYPGRVPPGTRIASPVSGVDLTATILEVASAPRLPRRAEARSLLPILAGGRPERAAVFSEYELPGRGDTGWKMVREGNVKYVRFGDGRELLYDLARDPYERASIEAELGATEDLARLRRLMDAWLESTPPL